MVKKFYFNYDTLNIRIIYLIQFMVIINNSYEFPWLHEQHVIKYVKFEFSAILN